MKRINSIFEAAAVIAVALTAFDISGIYDGFFFKLGVIVFLVYIGYVLKEIWKVLSEKKDGPSE